MRQNIHAQETYHTIQAGNLTSPSSGHQHHLVIHFDDAEHITETWTWRQDDKDIPMLFHLTRKKN
jgi:hypothetical protein